MLNKIVLFVLVVVFSFSFVLADDSWDSFDEGNGSSVVFIENVSDDIIGIEDERELLESSNLTESSIEDGNPFEYTSYFYIALGVGIVGILIAILFLYFFFRRPKNKWKK